MTWATLAVDTTASGTIAASTDVDIFKFTAAANETISFSLRTKPNLLGYLEVFDAAGEYLTSNSASPAPDESYPTTGAYIEYTFVNAGTYYVGVSSRTNTSYNPITGGSDTAGGGTGTYTLALSDVDAQDPNDQLTEATSLPVGSSVTDSISTVTDVDVYYFTAAAKQTISFHVQTTAGSNLQGYLEVLDSAGDYITSNSSSPAPNESYPTTGGYLEYTFPNAGKYYVAVSSRQNTAFNVLTGGSDRDGTMGGYTLTTSDVGAQDPNDQLPKRRPLPWEVR